MMRPRLLILTDFQRSQLQSAATFFLPHPTAILVLMMRHGTFGLPQMMRTLQLQASQ